MAHDRTLLPDDKLQTFLDGSPSWKRDGQSLVRTYRFSGFPDAVGFVVKLALAAEKANHHPDLDVRFNQVTVRLSTHDAGGITFRDVELGKTADLLSE